MADKKIANKHQKSKSMKKELKYLEIIKLQKKELDQIITETRQDITTLRYNTKLGDVQNVHACNLKKKYLARLLTAKHTVGNFREER
jgi:ribosomal protein L29